MNVLTVTVIVAICNFNTIIGQFLPAGQGGFPVGFPPNAGPNQGFPPNNQGFPPNGPNVLPNAGGFPANNAPGFFPNGPNNAVRPGGFPFGPGRRPTTGTVVSGNNFIYGTCYFNETGSNVRGRVDIRQLVTGGPCQVRVQVVGLPPSLMSDTEHGIHVHEYGDLGRGCYAAGPHYDSDSFSFHGSPNNLGTGNSHEGDMGNLRQSNAGVIDAQLTLPLMTLAGDLGIVGRAIVLHEGRDDLGRGGNPMSLQTGNAGAPIACCTIGLSDASNWNNPFIPRSNIQNTAGANQFSRSNTQNMQFNPSPRGQQGTIQGNTQNQGFPGNFQGK
ncbi:uncharacterized protein LOC134266799 [Saccostrea cucullata]|uniref:uncharacterized protein LOC134266799 n=1 Tax=Saccostrea cuccullata TaxID=36930 RepID=UPI002ED6626D